MAESKYSEVAQAMDEPTGSSWQPTKAGEFIGGIVTDLRTIDTDWGQKNTIDLRTEDGDIFTVWPTTILEDQITKQHVRKGDEILIKFFGEATTKKTGRPYKKFAVKVLARAKRKANDFEDDIPF